MDTPPLEECVDEEIRLRAPVYSQFFKIKNFVMLWLISELPMMCSINIGHCTVQGQGESETSFFCFLRRRNRPQCKLWAFKINELPYLLEFQALKRASAICIGTFCATLQENEAFLRAGFVSYQEIHTKIISLSNSLRALALQVIASCPVQASPSFPRPLTKAIDFKIIQTTCRNDDILQLNCYHHQYPIKLDSNEGHLPPFRLPPDEDTKTFLDEIIDLLYLLQTVVALIENDDNPDIVQVSAAQFTQFCKEQFILWSTASTAINIINNWFNSPIHRLSTNTTILRPIINDCRDEECHAFLVNANLLQE